MDHSKDGALVMFSRQNLMEMERVIRFQGQGLVGLYSTPPEDVDGDDFFGQLSNKC